MNDADRPPPGPHQGSGSSDLYRQWDAAYVLGALSPAERREFEEHLACCPSCQGEVAEIAGMPGLLAQLSPEDAAWQAVADDLTVDDQDTFEASRDRAQHLHGSVEAASRSMGLGTDPASAARPRRLTGAMAALAAAFVLLAGVVGYSTLRGTLPITQPPPAAPFRLAFSPVVPSDITAVVDVVPVGSATELHVECQYADEGTGPSPTGREFAIVVFDRAGNATEVKTWKARPAHKMTPSGTSSLPVSKIAAVEIRPVDSAQALLRADLR